MTVAELGRRVSSRELAEWMVVYRLEAGEQAEGDTHTALERKALAALRNRPGRRRAAGR